MIEYQFVFWKLLTPKVNIQIRIENEQCSVKRQIEGSNELGIRQICYP